MISWNDDCIFCGEFDFQLRNNKATSIPNLIDKKYQTYYRAANGYNGARNSALAKILNGLWVGIES